MSKPTTGLWLRSRRRPHPTLVPEAIWPLPSLTGASKYWMCPVFPSLHSLQKSNQWFLTSRVCSHSPLSSFCLCLDQEEGKMVFTAGGSITKESFSIRIKMETQGGKWPQQVHPQIPGPGHGLLSAARAPAQPAFALCTSQDSSSGRQMKLSHCCSLFTKQAVLEGRRISRTHEGNVVPARWASERTWGDLQERMTSHHV